MIKIGIVGHGANKFNVRTEKTAKNLIRQILIGHQDTVLVSGHSPMGGIDIWSEEIAQELGLKMDIKAPRQLSWEGEYGYKARNIDIAKSSDIIHNIVVAKYPENYHGMRFKECYHCVKHDLNNEHVKSGGCWTMWIAHVDGKTAKMHIIRDKHDEALQEKKE